jgi:L-ribulose-5-phosphate 3-epimerase
MTQNIGFMQGRLSPIIDGKIQSFPWETWRAEMEEAKENGFNLMEWTLDQTRLYENPLMTSIGQKEIRNLCKKYGLSIPSLTGDCFMQSPFWKTFEEANRIQLKKDFLSVLLACSELDIKLVIIPLVDNGCLDNLEEENCLVDFLLEQESRINDLGLKIIFESDFEPSRLHRFISRLNPINFGLNYDIGNSAALGFDPIEEFGVIGDRILNVHVKDRSFKGTTVPLGQGDANFSLIFELLKSYNYKGNYILQTARSDQNDHSGVLVSYKKAVEDWLVI